MLQNDCMCVTNDCIEVLLNYLTLTLFSLIWQICVLLTEVIMTIKGPTGAHFQIYNHFFKISY